MRWICVRFYLLLNSTPPRKQGFSDTYFAPVPMNSPLAPPMPAIHQEMEQPLNERVENS
jgi:hypothetical protein